MSDVVVVGAGLAGLLAARALGEAGRRVVILDEGQCPGGRLATRDLGGGRADSGAQFFTVRSAVFGRRVADWLAAGLVYEWSRGWSDGSLATTAPDGYPRYAARDGFRALAATLARGLDVRPATRVVALRLVAGGWRALSATGQPHEARALLLALPPPEALRLLDAGGVALPAAERAQLESIRFGPCLCGLFAVSGETRLPEPGALQQTAAAVSWMADNRRKGISPGERVVTVHAGLEASAARWGDADADVLAWLAGELRPWLAAGATIGAAALERWPHAAPLAVLPERCLLSATAAPLVFAGDAFGGPRVEGAALSGWAAAEALAGRL